MKDLQRYRWCNERLRQLALLGLETSQEYERVTAEMDSIWSRLSNEEQNEAEPDQPGVK